MGAEEDSRSQRICIVGAGFSGLTAAIQLKRKLGLKSFSIYDENQDVGGTWLLNTYPGCACDVQSHFYSWSFELNPIWSRTNAPRDEIWNYIKRTANKYGLYSHIYFNTFIKEFVWEPTIMKWRITILDKESKIEREELFDIIINGPGILRIPNYPKIFGGFKGPVHHSAEWDSSVNLENKVVGIVGSGASAVQIIPAIASKVKELHCYQRKPAWVKHQDQHNFSTHTKWIFHKFPIIMWIYRLIIFVFTEIYQTRFQHNPVTSKLEKSKVLKQMMDAVHDPILQEKLTPNYPVGCKRITFSKTYYPAMSLSNVFLNREEIVEVNEETIVTADGKRQKLDVLILATGFQVQSINERMRIIGKDSKEILGPWRTEGPKLYYGVNSSSIPNHFFLFGPNPGGSVLFLIECQVDFVIAIIEEMMSRRARAVNVRPSAEKEFISAVELQMKENIWDKHACGSWNVNARGIVTALWPWSSVKYWQKTRRPDLSKFEFTY